MKPPKVFDVLEVDIETRMIKIMAQAKLAHTAAAIERMAIVRRGTDKNFFTTVAAGEWTDGETYEPK
jgi:hypothetical protein|tara:strand:- start:5968 stop:6168 length:201 start_codon:yes stop_codon:yes gene_type:complete